MLNKLMTHFASFLQKKSSISSPNARSSPQYEMLQAMAQAYYEQRQEPPVLPATLETMKWAYEQICAGEDPWTALGNFTNAWFGYAKHLRTDLVSEALVMPEHETEYIHRWAAFCAASVELLCDRYCIPCPGWVNDPYYILETPWWRTRQAEDSSIRKHLLQTTPNSFAHRNIFCNHRLFQNKYEMYEWTQEAMNEGITSPDEIHRYVHQKEISIYGA